MEIHHLKQFIVISQCGSINSASQKLYISQPSLNNTVKRCEQELGFTVFLRTPKGIKLTEKGTQFIESAQKIITEYKKIEDLSSIQNTISSVSFIYLSYILESFLKLQEQGFSFSNILRRTQDSQIINDIISQRARIGILLINQLDINNFINQMKKYNLQFLLLFESIQMYVVVSKNHMFAKRKSISIKETQKFPLTYYTSMPEESIIKNIYNSHISLKVENRDELFLALKSNKYFSLLTLTEESKNPELIYIPIKDDNFKMSIYAISLTTTSFTEKEYEMIEFLKRTIHFL